MSSRRSVRQLLVAVLLGVLVGGGLMAVTPAGAEVSNAMATNWKKIWKKNLKPLADRRYYTKAQSDAKYSTKAETAAGDAASNAATDSKLSGYYKKTETDAKYAAAGSSYSKAETYSKAEADAKYAAAGSSYSKAESDGRYLRVPSLVTGNYAAIGPVGAAGDWVGSAIDFGVTLSAAPTVHYINDGAAVPAGCSGTATVPGANPGHLCIFEVSDFGAVGTRRVFNTANGVGPNNASTTGAGIYIEATGPGDIFVYGSWAVRPLAIANTAAASAGSGAAVTPNVP